ncbi:MAG: YdcF family protein [Oscillospiraceae bacterium]|jgi:vancomycin permeability regulator SanA|nr:YdcF family protein [Oscillospiraceae bacterium]
MKKKTSKKQARNAPSTPKAERRQARLMWVHRLTLLWLSAMALGGLALGVCNWIVLRGAKPYIVAPDAAAKLDTFDCILVLGAQVLPDGAPCPMLEDRLRQGVALYGAGISPVLLMSGDHGYRGYDEVSSMKQYAVDSGIPSAAVFMDHAGFSTYESMFRARDIFGAKRVLIVTQTYHLSRAVYIARRLGLEAYGVSSDFRSFAQQPYFSAREMAARAKDLFKCAAQPNPTFLGETIDLHGSGDATNDPDVMFVPRPTDGT